MHAKQQTLLSLIREGSVDGTMSYRAIAKLMGEPNRPGTVKYHLEQLAAAGLIRINLKEGILELESKGYATTSPSSLYSIPVVGAANCGPQSIFAEENVEQYLKVSTKILPRNKSNLYILIANGDSMNQAGLKFGGSIEDGDFVLVDSSKDDAKNGEVVVAVIDGMATIKEFYREPNRIVLKARSTKSYLPIYIHEGDDFEISGKVVGVIKK